MVPVVAVAWKAEARPHVGFVCGEQRLAGAGRDRVQPHPRRRPTCAAARWRICMARLRAALPGVSLVWADGGYAGK